MKRHVRVHGELNNADADFCDSGGGDDDDGDAAVEQADWLGRIGAEATALPPPATLTSA